MASREASAARLTYAGLFTVTAATLMQEILLTRIFSVTMWYHFAFMAISVATFGMSFGAVIVFVLPRVFTAARAKHQLAVGALLFSWTVVLSFLTHLSIPFVTSGPTVLSVPWFFSVGLTYAVVSVPFIAAGVCVSLALASFPGQVSRLYAADLAGASLGCFALILTLDAVDGPSAVVVVAMVAAVGALLFALDAGARRVVHWAVATIVLGGAAVAVNATLARAGQAPLRLTWVKGHFEGSALYERWNSFSRVRVEGDAEEATEPFGWGLSAAMPAGVTVRQLGLYIDAAAGTVITAFDGDLSKLDYLRWDVTNFAHILRPDAAVAVIGSGGGRDVLAAKVFGQRSVLAIEVNQAIIEAVNGRFGDFTGHLDRLEGVTFVADEARSLLRRSPQRFDIIQVSLIDTWAATAAGAFVLSENSLYTVEAWDTFLDHLSDRGVLAVSRWYGRASPAEVYRLVSLATETLRRRGVGDPRRHVMLVRHMLAGDDASGPDGVGIILVSREPFSDVDVATASSAASAMRFDMMLSPVGCLDPMLESITGAGDPEAVARSYPLDISPPTDDRPFFFNMLRLPDVLRPSLWRSGHSNAIAVVVLVALLATAVVLTALFVFGPLLLTTDRIQLLGSGAFAVFFLAIGLAFMLIEVSQIVRFSTYLGHPTYSLSVGLFSILLSTGLGSYSTHRVGSAGRSPSLGRLLVLLAVVAAFGLLSPWLISLSASAPTLVRIAVVIAVLFPMGLVMGMAFPLGIKLVSGVRPGLIPWLWGVNGAASVCASVLAVVLALGWGIAAAFWSGFGCYAVAVAAFARGRRMVGATGAGSSGSP